MKSLYALPEDSWVAQGSWSAVGSWLEAYRGEISDRDLWLAISAATDWGNEEPLLLVQGRTQIVALDLVDFVRCWRDMLATFDDGPILIDHRMPHAGCAVRFVPMGQVLSFKRR